jgi:5-methylcytosine-specific restriction endonuclease McrA
MSRRFSMPPWAYLAIGQRDDWTCHCGDGYRPDDPWEIDHWKSRAKGGTNHLHNLRLSHRSCNNDKSSA